MVKIIIVIRHAETQKDKNNPKRGLTDHGIKVLQKKTLEIMKLTSALNSEIIFTPTVRAKKSAEIMAQILKIQVRSKKYNLRVDNMEQLNKPQIQNLTQHYFDLYEAGTLSKKVPTPKTIARRFLQAIMESSDNIKLLIIVAHSGALESFIKYQSSYAPVQQLKVELKYSEFVVMHKT